MCAFTVCSSTIMYFVTYTNEYTELYFTPLVFWFCSLQSFFLFFLWHDRHHVHRILHTLIMVRYTDKVGPWGTQTLQEGLTLPAGLIQHTHCLTKCQQLFSVFLKLTMPTCSDVCTVDRHGNGKNKMDFAKLMHRRDYRFGKVLQRLEDLTTSGLHLFSFLQIIIIKLNSPGHCFCKTDTVGTWFSLDYLEFELRLKNESIHNTTFYLQQYYTILTSVVSVFSNWGVCFLS